MHEKFDSKMKAALPERKDEKILHYNRESWYIRKIEKQSIEEKDGLYTGYSCSEI